MKKLKLCNVHKLALSNEGEQRKPIHIPFGTWAYDDTIDQTLDREHADAIAADLAGKIAAGEPGIPVYQGHPDVPEYAGKYPDKGALGWVKKILVNESGMDLEVEWDRDPGKGFGWFSPYWTGDDPGPGASGKRNVIVDGLTSIGLVNNPNIREFRLANELQGGLNNNEGTFAMPQHLIDLAKRFDERVRLANEANHDESKHPRAEDGKWTSAGGGGGGAGVNRKTKSERSTDSFKRRMDEEGEVTELNELEAKYIKLSGDNPFDLSPEAEKALSDFNKKKADLQKRGIIEERIRGAKPGEGFRHKSTTDEMKRRTPVNMGDGRSSWTEEERKKFSDPTSHLKFVELAKRFDERVRLANKANYDESKHPRAEDVKWTSVGGSGGGGSTNGGAKRDDYTESLVKRTESEGKTIFGKYSPSQINKSLSMLRDAHSARKSGFTGVGGSDRGDAADRKSIHAAAIKMGFKYNRSTHQYE